MGDGGEDRVAEIVKVSIARSASYVAQSHEYRGRSSYVLVQYVLFSIS